MLFADAGSIADNAHDLQAIEMTTALVQQLQCHFIMTPYCLLHA